MHPILYVKTGNVGVLSSLTTVKWPLKTTTTKKVHKYFLKMFLLHAIKWTQNLCLPFRTFGALSGVHHMIWIFFKKTKLWGNLLSPSPNIGNKHIFGTYHFPSSYCSWKGATRSFACIWANIKLHWLSVFVEV